MRNLEDFRAPIDGEIPVCEINGRVHSISVNLDVTNINAFTSAVERHPRVRLTRDRLHPSSTGEEGRALFLPVSVPLLKQLVQVYQEQGFIEALQTVVRHNSRFLSSGARVVLKLITYSERVKNILSKRRRESSFEILSKLCQTRLWESSPIRCFSWHPYCTKIAVAGLDDIVRIYTADKNFVPLLKCRRQKNVSCLAWRPMSLSEIAVGCESEIIVWNVDPASVVVRPSISCATILYRINHSCVLSLSWSPRGDILASAASGDVKILVWDVEMDRTSALKRPGYSGNVFLKFSLSGDKLLTATTGLVFRVWNCKNWQPERWTLQSGRIQSASWFSSSDYLIFATTDEPILYGLSFKSPDTVFVANSESSASMVLPLYDLARVDLDGIIVGGLVQMMDLDPKDRHLAVIFKDSNCVVIFDISKVPVVQLTANALVSGLPEEKPVLVEFQKNFSQGSCLSIAWSSGRLQHYPMVYDDRMIDFHNLTVNSLERSGLHRSLLL